MSDEEIIDLFFERSEQAITELTKKHGKAAERAVRNILGDKRDAEECLSDTWLGVWNAIPPQRPAPLRTFVCRIARNLATKRYHANTAQKRDGRYDLALDELAECLPDRGGVEEALSAKELAEAIDRFLDTLSYEDRFLFMRRYWYADPLPEAARMAGMRYGTAAVHLCRIREKLKKQLLKEGVPV
ncbi:MAG: sigma-70 family RNA polymerase sigma factor [Eubacteriales bacterium]|nr:sigma-70 family RNA polymerase sigma factor [Eubacteriales bacterium]